MKRCPQCGREYNDSWAVCFKCSSDLVDVHGVGDQTVAAEIGAIRREIAKLNERLDRLQRSAGEAPASVSVPPPLPKLDAAPPVERARTPVAQPAAAAEPETPWEAGPQEEEKPKRFAANFEEALGGKWFQKLGVLAVVIGVALLIGYSFRYLGPAGKIAIGYLFAAAMIVFGRVIEKREGLSRYGKGLLGGGWAIAYFTTFALHHIPAVRLVANPFVGMLLLLAASAATVVDIYRYRSESATVFSYLLVFITLMITPVSFYTMAAAVPVACSLVFFMKRMRWATFSFYGMGMTYFTFMAWFRVAQARGTAAMTPAEFAVAAAFLVLYWAIFVVAVILMKDGRRCEVPLADARTVTIGLGEIIYALNTVIATVSASVILEATGMRYLKGALLFASAVTLALTAFAWLTHRRPLALTSSTFTIIYAASYLAAAYTGYRLTVAYILLAQVILFAGIILKEQYWRVFSFAALLLILGKLLIIDSFVVKAGVPRIYHLSGRMILFLVAAAVYLGNYLLYVRLGRKGLLTSAEKDHAAALSYFYPLIYAMGTWLDLPKVLTGPAWALLGVVLLQFGVAKDRPHQRIQGYILMLGAALRLLMSNMLVTGAIAGVSYRLMTVAPVLFILAYGVLLMQDAKTRTVLKPREARVGVLFPYTFFIVLMVLVWYEVPRDLVGPAWGGIALVYVVRAVAARKEYYLSISSLAAIAAAVRAGFVNVLQASYLPGPAQTPFYPLLTVAALYAGALSYLFSRRMFAALRHEGEGRLRLFLHSARFVYSLSATALLTAVIAVFGRGVLVTVLLGIEGLLLLVAGFGLKEKSWRLFGLIILLGTLGKIFLVDLRHLSTIYYIISLIVLGIALLFVSYIYTKHKDMLKRLMEEDAA